MNVFSTIPLLLLWAFPSGRARAPFALFSLAGFLFFASGAPLGGTPSTAATQDSTLEDSARDSVLLADKATFARADSLVQAGIAQMGARKYTEAQELFEDALALDPANEEAYCRLCQIEIVQGKNLERAEEFCLKAVARAPQNADYYYWLGAVYGLQALNGELIDALAVAGRLREAFQKALRLNPRHANARFAMAQYYVQAPQYAGGSVKAAKKLAQEALAFDEITARRIFAVAYRAEKKPAAAEDEYRRAIEKDRKNVEVLTELAAFYKTEKRWNESIECYERALAIDSTNIFALQELADVYALQRKFDSAAHYYRLSLGIVSRHTPSLYGLAKVYETLRDYDEAEHFYALAAKCDPKSKLGKESARRLKIVKKLKP